MKNFVIIKFLFCLIAYSSVGLCSDHPDVDIVYTWVDAHDPFWIKKAYDLKRILNKHCISFNSSNISRFANHDELKYSLRSVYQYAPFIRHIYIVTMGQKPKWLLDHPKVTIVDHRDIFLYTQHLPSFNSMAIESHIHRIEGLSEYFLYFNDDFFLTSPLSFNDFFTKDGKIKVSLSNRKSPDGVVNPKDGAFHQAVKNTNYLLNSYYEYAPRYYTHHAPYSARKSHIYETESRFSRNFFITSSEHFRGSKSCTLFNGLLPYDSLYQEKAVIGSLTNYMVFLKNEDQGNVSKKLDLAIYSQAHTLCIQDCFSPNESIEEELQNWLKKTYSSPAPWEGN